MRRSPTTPRPPRPRPGMVAVVVAALIGLPGHAAPAGGDPLADKRAEAERIAAELDAQGRRVSLLAEELNQARLRAALLTEQAGAAEDELRRADEGVARAEARLRARAVDAYVRGGRLPVVQVLLHGDPARDMGVRRAYASTVAGGERAAVEALAAAREQAEARRAELAMARRRADEVLAQVDGRRREAEAATAAQRATLAGVQGELAALVAEEAQRRAEEEARRAREELAARQAREAAAQEAAREAAARRAREEGARAREDAARRAREDAARRAREEAPRPVRPPAPTTPAPAPETGVEPERPPAPAAGAEAAVAEARRQLGKPYEYGASGPGSFDCSGLTMWAWRAGKRSLPHSSRAQYAATTRVPLAAVQPGDLLFYGDPIHHVGIYVGDGTMVEASQTGTPVRTASIYRRDLVGVGRVG